jgi:hypothetical protein
MALQNSAVENGVDERYPRWGPTQGSCQRHEQQFLTGNPFDDWTGAQDPRFKLFEIFQNKSKPWLDLNPR